MESLYFQTPASKKMDIEYTGLSYDQVSAMVARSTYCSMEFEYHCKGSPLKCKYGSWLHIPAGLNNLWLHLPVQIVSLEAKGSNWLWV